MFKNIAYKEWLKCRYAFIAIVITAIAQIVYVFVGISKSMRFVGSEHIWDVIVNRDVFLLSSLKYMPIIAACTIGLVQFIPEIMQKRIKLSLHLPLPENTILKYMLGFSQVLLLMFFACHIILIISILSFYFPLEIVVSAFYTLLPWYLSAFVALAFIPTICFEPVLIRKICLFILGLALVKIFYISDFPSAYIFNIVNCIILCVAVIPFAYISIDRFKRGVSD